jgi:hypothetical protein
MKTYARGFTQSILVTAPLSFTCLPVSYVSETDACAKSEAEANPTNMTSRSIR